MLTNNGINLLKMNLDYNFTNTIGEEYSWTKITGYYASATGGYNVYYYPITQYQAATTSADFTDEQTAYRYTLSYCTSASNASYYYYDIPTTLIFVGTGTDEVTADDYKLSNAAALSSTSAECVGSNGVYNTIRTFVNDTEEDITITEAGLYVVNNCHYSSTTCYPVLIAREVLSSPVTIGVGETYTFTYTINVSIAES